MSFDCSRADAKPFANYSACQSLSDQRGNFLFACCELAETHGRSVLKQLRPNCFISFHCLKGTSVNSEKMQNL